MTNLYGIEGFHYSIKNEAAAQRPLRAEYTGRRRTDRTTRGAELAKDAGDSS